MQKSGTTKWHVIALVVIALGSVGCSRDESDVDDPVLPFASVAVTSECELDTCGVCDGNGLSEEECTEDEECDDGDELTVDVCGTLSDATDAADCDPDSECCKKVCVLTCAPATTDNGECNSHCNATNSPVSEGGPGCACEFFTEYRSRLVKLTRDMTGLPADLIYLFGGSIVEHGMTRVEREGREKCQAASGDPLLIRNLPLASTFNSNHSQNAAADAAAQVVSDEYTGWTRGPTATAPCGLDGGAAIGYCAYAGAAGCECGTQYSTQPGGHVCNDDAAIQVSGFASGDCPSNATTCSDSFLATTAPF